MFCRTRSKDLARTVECASAQLELFDKASIYAHATSPMPADEMVELENETLRDRVAHLEKKVLEQNDEIICLRATLADAIRRISALETAAGRSKMKTP